MRPQLVQSEANEVYNNRSKRMIVLRTTFECLSEVERCVWERSFGEKKTVT